MLLLQLVESVNGISNNYGTSALSNSDSTKTPVKTLTTKFDGDSEGKYASTSRDKGIFGERWNWFHDFIFNVQLRAALVPLSLCFIMTPVNMEEERNAN
jgi:hypothetical protein